MADITLGTFEVTMLQQSGTSLPVRVPPGTPPPGPPPVSVTLNQIHVPEGTSMGTLLVQNLSPATATFAVSDVSLGHQYEVIFRPVAPVR